MVPVSRYMFLPTLPIAATYGTTCRPGTPLRPLQKAPGQSWQGHGWLETGLQEKQGLRVLPLAPNSCTSTAASS